MAVLVSNQKQGWEGGKKKLEREREHKVPLRVYASCREGPDCTSVYG